MKMMSYFMFLLILQLLCSWNSEYTGDWDESGNYWEPLHYMIYGKGVRTWEWHETIAIRSPVPLLPLSLLPKLANAVVSLSSRQIFFLCRFPVCLLTALAQTMLCRIVKVGYGSQAGNFLTVVLAFNQAILYYGNRINMDAMMAAFATMVLACYLQQNNQKQQQHSRLFIKLMLVACFIKYTFALTALGYFLMLLLSTTDHETRKRYCIWAVVDTIKIAAVFVVVDSWWFQRPTFSIMNALIFNIWQGQSSLFGQHSWGVYLDLLFRDNQAFVTVFAALGLLFNFKKSAFLLIPVVPSVIWFQVLAHKQERFIYFLYPTLSTVAALTMDQLYWKVGSKAVRKLYLVGIVLLLGLYSLIGINIMILRQVQYSGLAEFFTHQETLPYKRCLSNHPWVSWWSHGVCDDVYHLDATDEYFPGFNTISFTAFQHPGHSILYPYPWESNRPLHGQSECSQALLRANTLGQQYKPKDAPFDAVLLVGYGAGCGGGGVQTSSNSRGFPQRESIRLHYAHLLLQNLLKSSYQLTKQEYALGYLFDVDVLDRWLGLFYWDSQRINSNYLVFAELWTTKPNSQRKQAFAQ